LPVARAQRHLDSPTLRVQVRPQEAQPVREPLDLHDQCLVLLKPLQSRLSIFVRFLPAQGAPAVECQPTAFVLHGDGLHEARGRSNHVDPSVPLEPFRRYVLVTERLRGAQCPVCRHIGRDRTLQFRDSVHGDSLDRVCETLL